MTMLDSTSHDGAESAVKLVKLAGSDWRKMAITALGIIISLIFTAYQMAGYIAHDKLRQLTERDSALTIRNDLMEVRVKNLEIVVMDVAVLKNDVSWIRRELERKSSAPSAR